MGMLFGSVTAYVPPPMYIKVDRPFFYKIVFKNFTLFSGRTVNPLRD